ncbi:MAG: branched-chain amino acid ABC transporter permease [Chloroflexi bacterium]|uniref:Branched-chain amino acid ABC transporter permease n=1 Tax=Candidatus Chlorohelix allophototropha TaxID=3003348 RepID=A0A8T7M0Z6_9CHLR|nr:branched-chain amino acid ABC transporter permease [Chloroflexota bacterium]WJW67500.1 branched-chain amino acid ABC transporter permease [Chloroflexota bacterium L227-S17]
MSVVRLEKPRQLLRDPRIMTVIGVVVGLLLILLYINTAIKWSTFVKFLINGLVESSVLFLMASGLSLIFGLMDVVNFAHGAVFTWGGYIFVWAFNRFTTSGIPTEDKGHFLSWMYMGLEPLPATLLALVFGLIGGALLGAAIEFIAIRRLYGRPVFQILLTLGLVLIMEETLRLIFGKDGTINYTAEQWPSGGFRPDPTILVNWKSVAIVITGLVVFGSVTWLLNRTKVGLVIRGGVEDTQMVQALGYNVKRYFFAVFVLGSLLAALGGIANSINSGAGSETMGQAYLLTAFVVVVLGGLGSFSGAAVGSLMVGLITPFVGYHFPAVADSFVMILLVLVLLVRPQGLFGSKVY